MVVGVCGKYCAGKSALSRNLERSGFISLSVDEIGHQALEFFSAEIIAEFGELVCVDNEGNDNQSPRINRSELGNIVFSSKERLSKLESIVHPWMREALSRQIEEKNRQCISNIVIDAALLYHMGIDTLCDIIIIVHTHWLVRVFRAMRRDLLRPRQIIKRFRLQTHIPDKRFITKNKKNLNPSAIYSEIIVNGLHSFAKTERILYPLLKGVEDGREKISGL